MRPLLTFALLAAALPLSAQTSVRTVSVPAVDLVYDEGTGRLYGSVPAGGYAHANSVVAIDPVSGKVTKALAVGGSPAHLALSDDGSALYVGLLDRPQVVRIDVAAWKEVERFGLGSESFSGSFYANDIAVQPGNPDVVAVSRRGLNYSPSHEGVAIYDNGVPRSDVTQGHTGSNVIAFGSTPGRLYGYNYETTEFGFRRLDVDALGVREVSVDDSFGNTLIYGFSADIEFSGGRVYSSNGYVVDAEGRMALGQFPALPVDGGGSAYPQLVLPLPDLGRTVFLAGSGSQAYLLAYDNETFSRLGYERIDTGGPRDGYPRGHLVRWGDRGVAYPSQEGVVLVESALLGNEIVGIATSVTELDLGTVRGLVERTLTVSNPGTATLRVSDVVSDVAGVTFTPTTFEVEPGASIEGTLRFDPKESGYTGGGLTFASNALGGEYTVRVSAFVDVAILNYSETAVDFGSVEVGTVVERIVYAYNPSSRPITLRSIRSSSDRFSVDPSSVVVGAYDSRPIRISFAPSDAGSANAYLVIESSAYVPLDSLVLRASGVRLARARIDPSYLALGDVLAGRVVDTTVVVHNRGTDTLRVVDVPSDGPFSFVPTAFEVAPGDSLVGMVRFVAASLGVNSGVLRFQSNAVEGGFLYAAGVVVVTTDGDEPGEASNRLRPPAPNPVRASAQVSFETAEPGSVRLVLLDAQGREVRVLLSEDRPAGLHRATVDAAGLPSGTYFVRLQSLGFEASRPLVIVR